MVEKLHLIEEMIKANKQAKDGLHNLEDVDKFLAQFNKLVYTEEAVDELIKRREEELLADFNRIINLAESDMKELKRMFKKLKEKVKEK